MDDKESGEETIAAADDVGSDASMLCGNTGVTVDDERGSDGKVDGASDNGAFLTDDRDAENVDDAEYDIGTDNDDMDRAEGRSEQELDDSCVFWLSGWETVVVRGSKCEVVIGDSVTGADGGNNKDAGDDRGRGARDGG